MLKKYLVENPWTWNFPTQLFITISSNKSQEPFIFYRIDFAGTGKSVWFRKNCYWNLGVQF